MLGSINLEGVALTFYQDILKNDKVLDCVYQAQESIFTFYIIMAKGESPYSIISNTKKRFPELSSQIRFSFIHQIPFDDQGEINWQALQKFPSLSLEELNSWSEKLKLQNGISESALVLHERPIKDPALVLNQMLHHFEYPYLHNIKREKSFLDTTEGGVKLENLPAISHGVPLDEKFCQSKTLQDCLLVAQQLTEKGVYFIHQKSEDFLSYSDLYQDALLILNGLQKAGIKKNDFLIFQFQNSLAYLKTFWACILGGIIPAPVNVPEVYEANNSHVQKLFNVINLLKNAHIISDRLGEVEEVFKKSGISKKVISFIELLKSKEKGQIVAVQPDDPCLILFTSGSTGVPKGVLLKHSNILSMSAGTIQANNLKSADITLNWMPLDHVGAIVFLSCMAVDLKCSQIHVPTEYILQDSLRWLTLIDKYKATISWAPNFAFSLINDREPEIKLGHWNLSSMRFLVNAGEQITEKTAKKFLTILGQHYLPENCIVPAFGMSETCSGISWSLQFSLHGNSSYQNFVGLGRPIPGASFRIVNELNEVLKETEIGRFQLKGPSVFSGYYQLDEMNKVRFTPDGWFDSGDLGFLKDGYLYLTGRSKDDIIVNGINFFAHEIEQIIDELGLTEISYTAACPITLNKSEGEKLGLFLVPKIESSKFGKANIRKINEFLLERIGIKADFIVPLNKKDIPKTGIGKIQKNILRENFENGFYGEITKDLYDKIQFSNIVEKSILIPVWKSQKLKENAIAHQIPVTNILIGINYEIPQWINLSGNSDLYVLQQSSDFLINPDDVTQLDLQNSEHLHAFYRSIRKSSHSRDLIICVESGQNNDELISLIMSQQTLWSAWIRDVKLIVCGDVKDFEGVISYWANRLRDLSKRKTCSVLLCDNIYDYSLHELSNELFKANDAMVYFGNGKRQVLSWEKQIAPNKPTQNNESIKQLKGLVISGEYSPFTKELVKYFKNLGFDCYFLSVYRPQQVIDGCVSLMGETILEQINTVKEKYKDPYSLLYIHISIQAPFFLFSDVAKAFGQDVISIKVTSFQFGFDTILENARYRLNGRYFYLSSKFEENFAKRDLAELLVFIEGNEYQQASVCADDAKMMGRLNSLTESAFELTGYYRSQPGVTIKENILFKDFDQKLHIRFESVESFPTDYRGKIDYSSLGKKIIKKNNAFVGNSKVAKRVAGVWAEVLKLKEVPLDVTFFELGGHSLLIAKTQNLLQKELGRTISILELFKYPTVGEFAHYIDQLNKGSAGESNDGHTRAQNRKIQYKEFKNSDIAIIGMACRYPGADTIEDFWENLIGGKETIARFSEKEAAEAGVHPDWYTKPQYVFAAPVLENIDMFDADFFGISAREAELMDPQQRVAIEVAWQTMERAGYNPKDFSGSIGVYAGAGMNTYILNNILPNRNKLVTKNSLEVMNLESLGGFQVMVANDKDYIATRIAYCLDLKGPAVNVQTACSTTLVSMHMACQSLLNGEMDMALAGGVSVKVPQKSGYSHAEGMIVAGDGHCKAYDEKADGTIFGNGCGFVLLKRLEDALQDGDHIHAVVKGTSLNNDGGSKIGFAAPSEKGETSAISEAIAISGVDVETIGFVEGHGTGTELGDPIEVSSLTHAFRESTNQNGYCAIGSVKSNVGHLQIASGVVGFMKTALVVENGLIPPTLHFEKPNPKIDFANSPFYVNTKTIDWPIKNQPRRAGVNSLGIGGANTHAILEEPGIHLKNNPRVLSNEKYSVITVSGKDINSFQENLKNLYKRVIQNEDLDYRDICFTSNVGRVSFEKRFAAVVKDKSELVATLKNKIIDLENQNSQAKFNKVAFLFSGQGSQYPKMALVLYQESSLFRFYFDLCNSVYQDIYNESLLDIISKGDEITLSKTKVTQPALFALEVSLGKYWIHLGVEPSYLLGHSLGEYAAACVAEVFSIEDGMRLVIARSRLMEELNSTGGMLSVVLPFEKVKQLIANKKAWIAAINGPESIVLSGDLDDLNRLATELSAKNIANKFLKVSHAFHSPQMTPIINDFRNHLEEITMNLPKYEIISNITGETLSDAFLDPHYWLDHILEPVDFYRGVRFLDNEGVDAYLEIGPQATLLGLAKVCLPLSKAILLPSLRKNSNDMEVLSNAVALLYQGGISIRWNELHKDHKRNRVILPTYAFQRKSYWVEAPKLGAQAYSNDFVAGNDARNILGRITNSKLLKTIIFDTVVSLEHIHYCKEHKVFGEMVIPGAGHISMFLEAVKYQLGSSKCQLIDIVFPSALVVSARENKAVQLTMVAKEEGYELNLVSEVNSNDFALHASSKMASLVENRSHIDLKNLKQTITEEIPVTLFYTGFENRQIELGYSFRCVEKLWAVKNQSLAKLRIPEVTTQTGDWEIAPGLMDSCIQILMAAIPLDYEETLVPFGIDALQYFGKKNAVELWSHFKLVATAQDGMISGDVTIVDEHGDLVILIKGFKVRKISQQIIQKSFKRHSPIEMYNYQWVEKSLVEFKKSEAFGKVYLIVYESNFEIEPVVKNLELNGNRVVLIELGNNCDLSKADSFKVRNLNKYDLLEVFDKFQKQNLKVDSCLVTFCGAKLEYPVPLDQLYNRTQCLLNITQSLLEKNALEKNASLVIIDQDFKKSSMISESVLSSITSGFCQVLNREHPEIHGVCLHYGIHEDVASRLVDDLFLSHQEFSLLMEGDLVYVPRIKKAENLKQGMDLDVNGCYVITGGLGGLGLKTAETLIELGVKHLSLLGRTVPNSETQLTLDQWMKLGVQIDTVKLDIGNFEEVLLYFKNLNNKKSIKGIIHCAGVLDDHLIDKLEWQSIDKVFASKVKGTYNLNTIIENLELSINHFVCFSSVSSVLGVVSQANYGMANRYMDAIMRQRAASGKPGLSINWGPWLEVGMASLLSEKEINFWKQRGLEYLRVEDCKEYLVNILKNSSIKGQVIACHIDWKKFIPFHNNKVFSEFEIKTEVSNRGDILNKLANTPLVDRLEVVTDYISYEVATVLGVKNAHEIDLKKGLMELGLDSLAAVDLKSRLELSLKVTLKATLAFDYPTLEGLINQIAYKILNIGEVSTTAKSVSDENSLIDSEDIAAALARELDSLGGN